MYLCEKNNNIMQIGQYGLEQISITLKLVRKHFHSLLYMKQNYSNDITKYIMPNCFIDSSTISETLMHMFERLDTALLLPSGNALHSKDQHC